MVAHVATVAFLGLEARAVDVQVQIASGLPKFLVVGLPDKAVGESRERVHAALAAIGLSLPPKRITVNLSPADLPKEGSHYDLPIALGLLAAMGAVDAETLAGYAAVGELGLDGRLTPSPGVLLAAMHASCRLSPLRIWYCRRPPKARRRLPSGWRRRVRSRLPATRDKAFAPTLKRTATSSTASQRRTSRAESCSPRPLRRCGSVPAAITGSFGYPGPSPTWSAATA